MRTWCTTTPHHTSNTTATKGKPVGLTGPLERDKGALLVEALEGKSLLTSLCLRGEQPHPTSTNTTTTTNTLGAHTVWFPNGTSHPGLDVLQHMTTLASLTLDCVLHNTPTPATTTTPTTTHKQAMQAGALKTRVCARCASWWRQPPHSHRSNSCVSTTNTCHATQQQQQTPPANSCTPW